MLGPVVALTHAEKNVAKDLGNCSMCINSSSGHRLASTGDCKYWMSKAPHLMIAASTSSFERAKIGRLNVSLVSVVITPLDCKQWDPKIFKRIKRVKLLTT